MNLSSKLSAISRNVPVVFDGMDGVLASREGTGHAAPGPLQIIGLK
jgi:hypothetical protein